MSAEIETLHLPFKKFLETSRIPYTYHRPDMPTGATRGDADFILYRGSLALHIEFKDKETRISTDQKKRHAELAAAGVKVHILRSLQIAIETVYHWLSDVRTEAPTISPHSLFVMKVGDTGDHVVNSAGQVIRRATLTDVTTYPRTP